MHRLTRALEVDGKQTGGIVVLENRVTVRLQIVPETFRKLTRNGQSVVLSEKILDGD